MSFVVAGLAVAGGLTKVIMADQGRKARISEQRKANQELARRKVDIEGLDTSNPYANLENAYDDLKVNTQQAEFEQQANQQQQANIMQGMGGAAGGSGVAGLAQAMANQGQKQAQAASASIGRQESSNEMSRAKAQQANQTKERYGDQISQESEANKKKLLMGLSQQRKIGADAARQDARDMMASGIGDMAGGITDMAMYNK